MVKHAYSSTGNILILFPRLMSTSIGTRSDCSPPWPWLALLFPWLCPDCSVCQHSSELLPSVSALERCCSCLVGGRGMEGSLVCFPLYSKKKYTKNMQSSRRKTEEWRSQWNCRREWEREKALWTPLTGGSPWKMWFTPFAIKAAEVQQTVIQPWTRTPGF